MFIKYSVKNPVLVNLFVVVILVAGFLTYAAMPRELIPEMNANAIRITTFYAGASAEEIDKLITAKIEDAIDDLDDIEDIISSSQENFSTIVVTTDPMLPEKDLFSLLDDIRNEVDIVKSDLPEDADDPRVQLVKPKIPVVNVAVYGDATDMELKNVAEDLQDVLERIDGVSRVDLAGVRSRELWVEILPDRLHKYGLTLEAVQAAVGRAQLDLASGTIKSHKGEYLVRLRGERDDPAAFRDIVVYTDPAGDEVKLSDVARITDAFQDAVVIGRFNGKPSVMLLLSKNRTGDTIDVSDAVNAAINEFQKRLPPSIHVGTFSDTSLFVENRLMTLLQQGTQALVLVLATLCLFLTLRMAFFTALGIPVSFLGGVMVLGLLGYTMNMITMFAFIMVLGLVVDDAIVVTENCFRLIEKGIKPKVAAVIGTRQMFWPVVAAVATTVAAFLPLMFMTGRMGKFTSVIPVTVTVVLCFSLFECLVILPSHIADWTPSDYHDRLASRRENKSPGFFARFLDFYERVLAFVLRWRYPFVFAMFMLFALSVTYAWYCIPIRFAKDFEGDQFMVNIECSTQYKLEDTVNVAAEVEKIILSLPENELKGFSTTVGVFADDPYAYRFGSNLAQFYVDLKPLDGRRTTTEIIEDVRRRVNRIEEITKAKVFTLHKNPGGKDVEVFVSGPDYAVLKEIARAGRKFLERQPGAKDVQDDFTPGKRELIVTLLDKGRSLGFDNMRLATQLRTAYSGVEVARIRPGEDDYPVLVRFDTSIRDFRDSLEKIWLITPSGKRVRLTDVAHIQEQQGIRTLRRRNGKRTITVSADVNSKEGNATLITEALIAHLEKLVAERWPGEGYSIIPGGQEKELKESMLSLAKLAVVALLLILVILTALFKSLAKPLIIMSPIPLTLIGVVIGHVVHGSDLVILSMMGAVALAGVVVNDSILLVDFINAARRAGEPPWKAALAAGRIRMRPVILTTVTTICGLSSLAFFATGQTAFLSPMAITIVWGLAFATFITLLVVPCLYLIYSDVRKLLGKDPATEFPMEDLDAMIDEVEKSGSPLK